MYPLWLQRLPEDGRDRGRRVYRCGDCGRRHVEGARYHLISPEAVERIMTLYGESMRLRATGRVVGLSARLGPKSPSPQSLLNRGREGQRRAKLISFDEMWDYIGAGRGENLCGETR